MSAFDQKNIMAIQKHHRQRVAIVYPFLAHYRGPIFRILSEQEAPAPEYTAFSAPTSNIPSIEVVDPNLANIEPKKGGIRWQFVHNFFAGPLLYQTGIVRLALSRKFDTIIYLGNVYFISTWLGAILARLTGKRVLMWTHGFIREEHGITGWLRKRFYALAHGLLLYGNRAAHLCKNMGFDPDRLYVILNSLDYNEQVTIRRDISDNDLIKLRSQLFEHHDWPILIATCRLMENKRLDMILKAASLLLQRGQHVNVLLVGDGPARDSLKAYADELGIMDRVNFYGECHDEKILGPLISASSVCVMPGEVGLTAMHAMAYGTPVVTHDQGGFQMPEYEAIMPGETGALFRHSSVEDLVDKITAWLMRENERTETRNACYEIIDKLYNPYFQQRILNEAVAGIPASQCPAARTAVEPLFPENINI